MIQPIAKKRKPSQGALPPAPLPGGEPPAFAVLVEAGCGKGRCPLHPYREAEPPGPRCVGQCDLPSVSVISQCCCKGTLCLNDPPVQQALCALHLLLPKRSRESKLSRVLLWKKVYVFLRFPEKYCGSGASPLSCWMHCCRLLYGQHRGMFGVLSGTGNLLGAGVPVSRMAGAGYSVPCLGVVGARSPPQKNPAFRRRRGEKTCGED